MAKLFQDSGQTPSRRREEAEGLIERIKAVVDQLNEWETGFFTNVSDLSSFTPQQLFKLRDICERYNA